MIDLNICKTCKFRRNVLFFGRNRSEHRLQICPYFYAESAYIDTLNKELNLENSKKQYVFAKFCFVAGKLEGEKFYHVKNDFPKKIMLKPKDFDIQKYIDKYPCELREMCPYFIEQEISILSKCKDEGQIEQCKIVH